MASICTVASITALRALARPLATNVLFVEGYTNPSDGGGGIFCNSGMIDATDNGGTIIVDSAKRVWQRQTSGAPYNVRWFGAKGNGETDDTVAIQRAINAVQTIRTAQRPLLVIPAGVYLTSSPIVLNATIKLAGEGPFNTYILTTDLADDTLKVVSDPSLDQYLVVEICGLQIHAIAPKTAGYGVSITSAKGCACGHHYYHDLFLSNMFGGMYIAGGSGLTLSRITISTVGQNSQGFYFDGTTHGSLSQVRVSECCVETGVAGETTTGILIESGSRDFHFSQCSIGGKSSADDLSAGFNYGLRITKSLAADNRPANLFFEHLACSGSIRDACRIDAAKRVHFDTCSFSGSLRSCGLYVCGSGPGHCDDILLRNCVIEGNYLSGVNILSDAQNTRIMGCAIADNGMGEMGYSGITIQDGTTNFMVVGNTFRGREASGISIGVGCDWFIVTENSFFGLTNSLYNASSEAAHSVVSRNLW